MVRSSRWCLAVAVLAVWPMAARADTLRGVVIDKDSGAPLPGVTVVVAGPELQAPETTISDEDGGFAVQVPAGVYKVTVYRDVDVDVVEQDGVQVDDSRIDPPETRIAIASATPPAGITIDATYFQNIPIGRTFGDVLGSVGGTYDSDSAYVIDVVPVSSPLDERLTMRATTVDELTVLWRRDHRGLDVLDARMTPDLAATTADRALRLPGAPAIALELMNGQRSFASNAPIDLAGGAGGVDVVELLHGGDEERGVARVALGRTGRYAAIAAGEFDDDAHWAVGTVLETTAAGLGTQTVTSTDFEMDDTARLDVSALITTGPGELSDWWGQARGFVTGDGGKREIEFALVGQDLTTAAATDTARAVSSVAPPAKVTRLGGKLALRQRGTWRGKHRITIGGEVGGGHADLAPHADVGIYGGDVWDVTSNLRIEAGARWDRRAIDDTTVELLAPRVALSWDPTKKGTAALFVAAERAGRLDEHGFGAWRDGDTYRDTAVAGYARGWHRLRVTAAMRGRLPRGDVRAQERLDVGFEGSAALVPAHERWRARATVSTLDRAATFDAGWSCGCDRTRFLFAGIARVTRDDVAWGGAITVYRQPPDDDHAPFMSVGVETLDLDDSARRSAHLILSGGW